MQNRLRVILITLFVAFIAYGIYKIFLAFSEDIGMSATIPKEYLKLFPTEHRQNLVSYYTHFSKVRNPVTNLDYGLDYGLIIYRIDLKNDSSLEEIIKIEDNVTSPTASGVYTVRNQDLFEVRYKSGKPALASEIYLGFRGDSLKTVAKNDSVACYYMECYRFSMRYGKDAAADIYAETKKDPFVRQKLPMSVLLLRRGKTVYFVLMSVNDKKTAMAEDFLYRTVILNR